MLTVSLEVSKDIEEEVDVSVALLIDNSFSQNVDLSKSNTTKKVKLSEASYFVKVKESGDYVYEYPDTIDISKDKDNKLVIKVLPKTVEEDPTYPMLSKGTLAIDFCNAFDATMHYEIYKNSYDSPPVYRGVIDKDAYLFLAPGTYYISCRLAVETTGIRLWGVNEDGESFDCKYKNSFTIEKGKTTYAAFYIDETEMHTKNSRIVINPIVGKELLGTKNDYGHDVSISYDIKYGTNLQGSIEGKAYDDTTVIVNIGYETIPVLCDFTIKATNGNTDVSDDYVLVTRTIYSNPDQLQGETETKHTYIYRGKPIKFTTDVVLEENQMLAINCEQFYMRTVIEDEEGRFKLAYDEPFGLTIRVYEKNGDDWTFINTYYEGSMTISEGCYSVIHIKGNQEN